ncbi:reverse transcriptase domain-containing protein [Tanacetum coccineum]
MGSRAAGIRQRDALPVHETEMPEMCLPLHKRPRRTTPGPGCEVGESSAAGAARQVRPTTAEADLYGFADILDAAPRCQTTRELGYDALPFLIEEEADYLVPAWASDRMDACDKSIRDSRDLIKILQRPELPEEAGSSSLRGYDCSYCTVKMAPRGRPTRTTRSRPVTATPPPVTTTPPPVTDPTTTTSVTGAQLQAMIDEGVTAVLAARATTRNGDDSHTSGTGARRNERTVRECTYQDFMKCQPLFFRGTEGAVDLTQWWSDLKKKMTTKYCPRNEIKKIEVELWNLKVKGTDVVAYNQRFQELALLCDRMFPEETDKIERYVGGMPDPIYSSVVASKPKTMQEAIEMHWN